MSRKALEMEHLSLYGGSVRGTWREGSCTEDSERHVWDTGRIYIARKDNTASTYSQSIYSSI
jgi:hypothetical protein